MPNTLPEILAKAMAYCATAERSVRQVMVKLQAWEATEEQQALVLQRLQEGKFLDEARYARAYAHDKFRFNGWGKRKIALYLRHEQLDESVIRAALDELPEESVSDKLADLLAKKRKSLKGDAWTVRQKLLRFAVSRGFSVEEALQVLPKDLPMED